MTTTPTTQSGTLFIGIELSKQKWKLAFSQGQKIRQVTVAAWDQGGLREAVTGARKHLGLSEGCAVRSCYEAGRDGFSVHRLLQRHGMENVVVDAASIEVNRRFRRAKTDRLDAEKLVRMLMRYWQGERTVWRVARVPSVEEEDARRLHRELERLRQERTGHWNRICALLALVGAAGKRGVPKRLWVAQARTWDGQPLPVGLRGEVQREWERLERLQEQICILERNQASALKQPQTGAQQQAQKLARVRSIGEGSGWLLAHELFGWRKFRNRREVGAAAGLVGTPYASGESAREQGISKAGNKRVRWLMVELAWSWLRLQPQSELSQWWWKRFGQGAARQRRVGIVALARKLLIALWRYTQTGLVPAGAVLKAS